MQGYMFTVLRIWIRMDPDFFADPDPDFKNPDQSFFSFSLRLSFLTN